MQSLSAGGYLNPLKQEVKALRRSRRPSCFAWRGVKRAAGERVSNYKYRGDPSLLLHKSAQLPFSLRVEIICQIRSAEVLIKKFEASAELPDWDSEHRWEWMLSITPKNVFMLLVEPVKDVGQELTLDLNNVLRPVNEAHLEIE